MTRGFFRSVPLVLILVLLLSPTTVSGQASPEEDEPKTPPWLVLAFEQRTRVEKMTNRFRIDELGATRVLAFRTRLYFEIRERTDPFRFVVELQDSRSGLNDDPFVVTARHINELDFLQLQLQLVSDRFFATGAPTALQIGRFTLDLGKRRLSARNSMRNTTNAFDGLHWRLGTDDRWVLRAFVARPVLIKPKELDSSNTGRYFWGVYYQNRSRSHFNFDLYYLGLDENESTMTRRKYSTLGGRIYKGSAPGQFDYEIESSWQLGKTDVLDHFAHFQHGELGYVFDSPLDPRLSFHYDYVSGDEDRGDDRLGRFDTLFGARRFEYSPTGIYGPFFRSNLHTPGVRFAVTPNSKYEILGAFRAFWLAQARDVWVGSGLEDPSGAAGSFLGTHFETRARFRPLKLLTIELGYAHFFKGSYLERVPESPRTPDSDYFYAEVEIRVPLLPRE